jgi:hypothetical protein
MSVYLIDYENVHSAGLEGVENLSIDDEVVMFYGNDGSSIPMELHVKMAESKASIRYIRTNKTAKNYLDFQLSAISGYLVATTKQNEFIVISKDSGFNSVLDLWNNQDFVGRRLIFSKRDQIAEDAAPKKKRSSGRKKSSPLDKKEELPVKESAKGAKSSKSSKATSKKSNPKTKAKEITEDTAEAPAKKTEINKAAIRACVSDLDLKPQDYTKMYKVFASSPDKNVYNMELNKIYKDQDKANAIYKATRKEFEKQIG